jgi:hypothetical protein
MNMERKEKKKKETTRTGLLLLIKIADAHCLDFVFLPEGYGENSFPICF